MLIHLCRATANADGEMHATTSTNVGPDYIRSSFISRFLRGVGAGRARRRVHRQTERTGTAGRALVLSD